MYKSYYMFSVVPNEDKKKRSMAKCMLLVQARARAVYMGKGTRVGTPLSVLSRRMGNTY